MRPKKWKSIVISQKDNPKLYQKFYYEVAVRPHIKRKKAKFLMRGICGLCGMNFRPKNLFKSQSLRFKVVTLGGRGMVRWLDYNIKNLPEEERTKIRKAIIKNTTNMLLNLNLTDIEKKNLTKLLGLKTTQYTEEKRPSFTNGFLPISSSKEQSKMDHTHRPSFTEKIKG